MPIRKDSLRAIDPNLEDRVFFEMGTNDGQGLEEVVLDHGYKKVISVEIVRAYIEEARIRLANHPKLHTLTIMHGDAIEQLKLTKEYDGNVTIYIDAHFADTHYNRYIYEAGSSNTTFLPQYPELERTLDEISWNTPSSGTILILDDVDTLDRHQNFWSRGTHIGQQEFLRMVEDRFKAPISYEIFDGGRKRDHLAVWIGGKP